MEKLLVFQHIAHEHPGTFTEVSRDHDLRMDTIRFWEESSLPSDIGSYSRLLIMGGPQSVYDISEKYPLKDFEMNMIRKFTETGRPVLGVSR